MTDEEMMQESSADQQLARLREIVHRLRAPGGCPWDAEQSHISLLPCLIEETYEVVDTVQREDYVHLQEELGDLLLQVVFHAELLAEAERGDLNEVARGISEKLIRRHPHVFTQQKALSADGVLSQWEDIKRAEKGDAPDLPYLDKVGEGLPALLAAAKIQKKAAKVGFDWPDAAGVVQKIKEELSEVEAELENGSEAAVQEELGDLLFSVVNLSRKLKFDPELLLHQTNKKFTSRFHQMECFLKEAGLSLKDATLEEMEARWNDAKNLPHSP